jgi:hypothetical protein
LALFAGHIGAGMIIVNLTYLSKMPDLSPQEKKDVIRETTLPFVLAASAYSVSILMLFLGLENSGIRLGVLLWIPLCAVWIIGSIFMIVEPDPNDSWFGWILINDLYAVVILITALFVLGFTHSVLGWP